MSVMRDVLTVFENIWKDFVKVVKGWFSDQKNDKSSQIIFILLIVGLAGYGGFRFYKSRVAAREARAHQMFTESMQLYMKAMEGQEQWEDVAGAYSLGYEQNGSSRIAPFFKLFQADALLNKGEKEQALPLMEEAIGELDKKNALRSLYEVKIALINIDSEDQAAKDKAIQELEKIAATDCSAQNIAAYYLGLYHWQEGQKEKAETIWAQLPKSQEDKNGFAASSPLRDLVANKLGESQ